MPARSEHLVPHLDGVVVKHSPASHRLRRAARNNKRLLEAMVLDRMDVELVITRLDADVCHAAVDNSPFCQPGFSTQQ